MKSVSRKRSLFVTGASRGIGAAIATCFREEGWDVVAPARSELDLGNPDQVQDYLARKPIRTDALILNAGINLIFPIQDIALADFRAVLDTNLTSSPLLVQNAAEHMMAQHWGRTVFVSSIYSNLARPGRSAYSSSKAALNALIRSVALEYGPHGVLSNSLCPGFVETDMTRKNNTPQQIAELAAQTALGRLAKPEEIAKFAYFLASEVKTYLTGQMIQIDGGFSIQ